jgi:probable DNA metabolism protein
MQAVLYDGTFEGFLCAVFDVYYYKYSDVSICPQAKFQGNLFEKVHTVSNNLQHSLRLMNGLQKKLSPAAWEQLYHAFLSESMNMEDVLLRYIQYVFAAAVSVENDFGNEAVLQVHQTAKKVHREKHRMEAFVRFQQTADELFYAIVEPDYNVLPLLIPHFQNRYADQRWMIWDGKRHYGIYYDKETVTYVQMAFDAQNNQGKDISHSFHEKESLYQQLWQQYFKSVNISARKNTRLHLQHMPVRYWKFLPEKRNA